MFRNFHLPAVTAGAALALLMASALASAAPPARRPVVPPHATGTGPVLAPGRDPRAPVGLERDTLAWVADRAVTALDLVQRIEWMPWPEKRDAASMEVAKTRAVQSLVAEALLARETDLRSPTGGPALARARGALRRALARDALYRLMADQAPAPTPAEIDRFARVLHPGATAGQMPGYRRVASDSLRQLAGQKRAVSFMIGELTSKRVEVDSLTFMLLADSLRSLMVAAQVAPVPGGGLLVPSEAPDVLLTTLAPSLERTLAHLPDGPLTLGDALEDMRFYLVVVHSLEPARFAAMLSANLRSLVEGELMAREAIRRRLDARPELTHDVAMWTGAWRARSLLETVAAGPPASDDEAFRSLALHDPEGARTLCEVDLQEILCGSRQEADDVRLALARGAAFDSLARRHSRRPEWAASGGRSGFFPIPRHLELGFSALLSRADTLVGPLQLPEGFSIYRVLGKRLANDTQAARDALQESRARVSGEQRTDRAARYVGTLANRTAIRFDPAALRRVAILPSNMVVKRSLGYGGGMTAAPSLPPLWEWTRYWQGTPTLQP